MKNKIAIVLFISISVIILSIGCKKSSEDKLATAAVSCDTTSVKYSTDIIPIMVANCYSCHGTSSNGGSGGIILEGYVFVSNWAKNGYLRGNVTHAPGFVAMPYGKPKLPDCEVNKIVAWINQGYKNN